MFFAQVREPNARRDPSILSKDLVEQEI